MLILLTSIVFLTLKLADSIDWSWGYVLLPVAWFFGMFHGAIVVGLQQAKKSR